MCIRDSRITVAIEAGARGEIVERHAVHHTVVDGDLDAPAWIVHFSRQAELEVSLSLQAERQFGHVTHHREIDAVAPRVELERLRLVAQNTLAAQLSARAR